MSNDQQIRNLRRWRSVKQTCVVGSSRLVAQPALYIDIRHVHGDGDSLVSPTPLLFRGLLFFDARVPTVPIAPDDGSPQEASRQEAPEAEPGPDQQNDDAQAEAEQLQAHAEAVRVRLGND